MIFPISVHIQYIVTSMSFWKVISQKKLAVSWMRSIKLAVIVTRSAILAVELKGFRFDFAISPDRSNTRIVMQFLIFSMHSTLLNQLHCSDLNDKKKKEVESTIVGPWESVARTCKEILQLKPGTGVMRQYGTGIVGDSCWPGKLQPSVIISPQPYARHSSHTESTAVTTMIRHTYIVTLAYKCYRV